MRKDGHVVIVWNERTNNSQTMKAVNKILLSLNQEHEEAEKNLIDKKLLNAFYGVEKVSSGTFPNYQMLDLAGLKGRIHSISYVPETGSENKRVMSEVKDVFEKFNNGGQVKMEYTTRVFYGKLK